MLAENANGSDSIGKLFAAYLRRAEEGALSGLLVEITILHAAIRQNSAPVLRDAATAYKVDVDAISLKVKHDCPPDGLEKEQAAPSSQSEF